MKISVIVGILNANINGVERLILSFINQDYKDKELIIIDGGSDNGLVELYKKYNDKIDYWVSEPDDGLTEAYKKGLRVASGDYAGFIGGTDWYELGAFEAVANCYNSTFADVIYGDTVLENEKGQYIYKSSKNEKLNSLFYCSRAFCTVSVFVKKEYMQSILERKVILVANDVYLFGRLYAEGRSFAYVDCGFQIGNFSYGGVSTSTKYPIFKDARKSHYLALEGFPELQIKWQHLIECHYAKDVFPLYRDILNDRDYIDAVKKSLQFQDKEYIIFGSGKVGQLCKELFGKCGITIKRFVDNNTNLWNTYIGEIMVDNPKTIEMEDDVVVFISVEGYCLEIQKQVERMNIKNNVKCDTVLEFYFRLNQLLGDKILEDAYEKRTIV